jgi:dihydrofolate synthase/folylpolyglutamate synthase
MNYNQTIEFLYSRLPAFHRIGKAAYKNNLDNIIALDDCFGHPHFRFKTIHIAGTNGKGSVSHMLASILNEAGYNTGLYTSPHLKDFRERIKINGQMIPESEVIAFVRKNRGIIDSVKPSFFEMSVVMAFDYFARMNVDVAVIEAGLGGRLDSTNIITPVISVITNIGHDHMDLLGNTIEKVAAEKAGIIKRNIPVVIGESQKETGNVFNSRASETGSELFFADMNFSCNLSDSDSQNNKIYGIIPLGGDYQEKNLMTVFQVFRSVKDTLKLSESSLLEGIKKVVINTGLKGRWQILNNNPLTICDTAHNKEGLEYVIHQIQRIPSARQHLIIGFVDDKDLDSILPLFPKNAEYYFTKASVPRALNENTLLTKAKEYGMSGKCYSTVNEAYKAARENASFSDLIFIGGSTFVVAEVI